MHVAKIQRRSIEWGDEFQLFRDPKMRAKFAGARFGWLVSRCFHYGSEARLQAITDLTTWIFVEDDDCDEGPAGSNPDYLQTTYDRLRRYLSGALPLARAPLDLAFHELSGRLARLAPDDAWHKRICQTLSDYFDSSVWEAENRKSSRGPSVGGYRSMRRLTGGLPIYIDLIELAMGESLPIAMRRNPLVMELANITNDVTCWHNDIYSFAKEKHAGDVHNLIHCLQSEHRMDRAQATALAVKTCDAEVERFIGLVEALLFAGERPPEAVFRYVTALSAIIQGNVDWSYESARYGARARRQRGR
jgi:5-epi-alpha-selinene synthase